MLHRSMTKAEIEKEISRQGDFVKIDNLTRFLDGNPPLEIRKYVCELLAQIYEKRNMFGEAAKKYKEIANMTLSQEIKNELFLKEIELYIKAGDFERADIAAKSLVSGNNSVQKTDIEFKIKNFYKKQAEKYEKENRKGHAVRCYETLMHINLDVLEKEEIKKKLIRLYEQLGRVKEYMILSRKK